MARVSRPDILQRRWTPEDDRVLRSLAGTTTFAAEIGERLNRSAMSVQNRARRLGISLNAPGKSSRMAKTRRTTPELIAARNATLLKAAARALEPEIKARRIEAIRDHYRDRLLAWCPAERAEEYRLLKKAGLPAAEAKRVIVDDIASKQAIAERAKRAFDRSFEGQLALAKAGARIESRVVRPANDYHLTLGGVAQYG